MHLCVLVCEEAEGNWAVCRVCSRWLLQLLDIGRRRRARRRAEARVRGQLSKSRQPLHFAQQLQLVLHRCDVSSRPWRAQKPIQPTENPTRPVPLPPPSASHTGSFSATCLPRLHVPHRSQRPAHGLTLSHTARGAIARHLGTLSKSNVHPNVQWLCHPTRLIPASFFCPPHSAHIQSIISHRAQSRTIPEQEFEGSSCASQRLIPPAQHGMSHITYARLH